MANTILKCVACGQRLHRPAQEALQRLHEMGFVTGQFCCRCFSTYAKIYAILSANKKVVVQLNTPVSSGADGKHQNTWWTSSTNVVIRKVPEDTSRYDKVLAKLVFANHKIIVLKFIQKVTCEDELERIGDDIWRLKHGN